MSLGLLRLFVTSGFLHVRLIEILQILTTVVLGVILAVIVGQKLVGIQKRREIIEDLVDRYLALVKELYSITIIYIKDRTEDNRVSVLEATKLASFELSCLNDALTFLRGQERGIRESRMVDDWLGLKRSVTGDSFGAAGQSYSKSELSQIDKAYSGCIRGAAKAKMLIYR